MMFGIADNLDASSIFRDRIALGNGIRSVVGPFGLNVGVNLADDGAHVEFRKDYNRIYVGQGGHNFRALFFRHDRTALALESPNGLIRIDGHDKFAAEGLCSAQVTHVPDVQQIKTAVSEGDALAGAPPFFGVAAERFAAQNFVLCVQWGRVAGGDCSSASNSSSCETVAVPRFMTTMPAA